MSDKVERKDELPEFSFPKHKIKVLLMESISVKAVEVFESEGYKIEQVHKLTPEALKEKIADVHLIGVRSKTKLTEDVLKCAKKLLAIGCFCIGTDQTNLGVAAKMGVPVFNAPFANTRSVAELVVAEMIFLARQAGDRSMECHSGKWLKRSKGCYEVRGKTLGIIGYGHVGSQLSVLAEALGLRVIFYDIISKMPLGNASAAASKDEVLKQADFVSLHVPRTQETNNMIGAEELAMMKPGSFLIQLSRGTVVDVDATAAALKSGHLAGAAFDVYPKEPASSSEPFVSPLRNIPNVILTPHIGGSTEEAQSSIGTEVSNKLRQFVNTGSTLDAVNFPAVAMPQDGDGSTHRILNVHHSHPGVLREINKILSAYNISMQVLRTRDGIGYIMVDVDKEVSSDVKRLIDDREFSVCTRILY